MFIKAFSSGHRQLAQVAVYLRPFRSAWTLRSRADTIAFHDYETTGQTGTARQLKAAGLPAKLVRDFLGDLFPVVERFDLVRSTKSPTVVNSYDE